MPEQIGKTNMFNVFDDEYIINVDTGEKIQGPFQARVQEINGKILMVQVGQRQYTVNGDNKTDFLKVVKKD